MPEIVWWLIWCSMWLLGLYVIYRALSIQARMLTLLRQHEVYPVEIKTVHLIVTNEQKWEMSHVPDKGDGGASKNGSELKKERGERDGSIVSDIDLGQFVSTVPISSDGPSQSSSDPAPHPTTNKLWCPICQGQIDFSIGSLDCPCLLDHYYCPCCNYQIDAPKGDAQ